MSLRKAAALMDCPDDNGVDCDWMSNQAKGLSDSGDDTNSRNKAFRVPGLSSSDDSSGTSSDEDASSRLRADTPWRRRKKRHRPASVQAQPFRIQSPMDEAAMMDTEQPLPAPDGRQNPPTRTRRTPNSVWASVLTDSVLDDAMHSQMHMYRSDRDVESYAYRGPEARCGLGRPPREGQGGGRRRTRKPVLEEGELSDNEEEEEEEEEEEGGGTGDGGEDDGEDSHSDSLSIDNNVDPGEFAREGFRGRYDMEEIEDMDTNSRSAPSNSCLPSTSSVSTTGGGSQLQPENAPASSEQTLGRKRPRKKRGQHRSQASRGSARSRLGKRVVDPSKTRPSFELGPERTDDDIASAIADRLEEPRSDLLLRCVRILGRDKAYHTLLITEDLEASGGLYTVDGSRRRTPGGVYFHLIKEDDESTAEQKRQVFAATDEEVEARKEKKRRKRISAGRRLHHKDVSSSSIPASFRSGSTGPVPPPEDYSSSSAPFTVGPPTLPGNVMALSNLTPPHASTTSSSPPSSTLASTEAASSGKTPNNSPHPAPLEVDDF